MERPSPSVREESGGVNDPKDRFAVTWKSGLPSPGEAVGESNLFLSPAALPEGKSAALYRPARWFQAHRDFSHGPISVVTSELRESCLQLEECI